jgi:addiction module HigA family antidote
MLKNPVHPGKLVEANLEELGLTVAEAAKAMKVTRQQIHNVIRGKGAVSPEMALRFEEAFAGSATMWLRMQNAYDLAQARKHRGRITIRRLGEQPSLA